MGFFRRWAEREGDRIGKQVVDDMVVSGDMESIVRNAMADQFEKLSHEPEYAHCAARLRKMAERARNGSTR